VEILRHREWHTKVGQLQCRKCPSRLDSETLLHLPDLELDLEGLCGCSFIWVLGHDLICFVSELSEELGCGKFGTFLLDYEEFVLADSTESLLSLGYEDFESEVGGLELDALAVEGDDDAPVQQSFGRSFHLICI